MKNHSTRFSLIAALIIALVIYVPRASAQYQTQSIVLQPGWNAVYLEVTPVQNTPEQVFGGLPVKSVWMRNDDSTQVKFIQDATQLLPDQPGWLTYFPAQPDRAVLKNLFFVQGGYPYMIELNGTQSVTWNVTGRRIIRNLSWRSGSYSLTGLSVDPASTTTFAQFFAGSTAHAGQDIKKMLPNGTWVSVPSSQPASRGQAYWVYTSNPSTYQGPASVLADQRGLLDFGTNLVEEKIELSNATSSSVTFTLSCGTAAIDPTGADTIQGPVLLSIFRISAATSTYGWATLDTPQTVTVAANKSETVRLSIRRPDMVAGGTSEAYRSILKVTGVGTAYEIGLRAGNAIATVVAPNPAPASGSPRTGLWVGNAIINSVNQPSSLSDSTTPKPTAADAQFRLMVHVDSDGTARLMREAIILWVDGITAADGTITQAGRYVIATGDTGLSALQAQYGARLNGSTVRDGQTVGRRLSSSVFSFNGPQTMGGQFGNVLSVALNVDYNDRLNPFKHRYHPDHDNQDARYLTTLQEGQESFTIGRQITLSFSASDPEGLATSGWGDTTYGGIYQETVTGVHKNALLVKGIFRLVRAVQAGGLDK